MLFSSVNGKVDDLIAPSDRGLSFGDGHFTTAKITNGSIEFIDEHIHRLKCASARIKMIGIDYEKLKQDMIIAASRYSQAVLKVIITTGNGGRGYSRKGVSEPTVIINVSSYPNHYGKMQANGIVVDDAETKLGINSLLAGFKHLNRLEQVLVKNELEHRQIEAPQLEELIVCDQHGYVTECSCANIFWYQSNQWQTPKLNNAGVNGIMRQYILSQQPEIEQVKVTPKELVTIEAMFICNSLMKVVPVKQYGKAMLNTDIVHQFSKQVGI